MKADEKKKYLEKVKNKQKEIFKSLCLVFPALKSEESLKDFSFGRIRDWLDKAIYYAERVAIRCFSGGYEKELKKQKRCGTLKGLDVLREFLDFELKNDETLCGLLDEWCGIPQKVKK